LADKDRKNFMKTFQCTCGQLIFFHNISCMSCNRELGFCTDSLAVEAIEPAPEGLFVKSSHEGGPYRKCQNYAEEAVCNWMIPEPERDEVFCKSCRLTETIPDLTVGQNRIFWALMESAKRRLIYSLLNLRLPVMNKLGDPEQGLVFRFLSDVVNADGTVTKVLTGHDNGIITLNIAEADDAFRERTRLAMNEPYRTLLGHFRHEIGHYYWERLVRDMRVLDRFRALFGDEKADYAAALQNYYSAGAKANWQIDHVSAYSTAHPWEDWAETWAHFMHIQDTLEVAEDFGIRGKRLQKISDRTAPSNGAQTSKFDRMMTAWLDLAVALNSINRSMGHQDLYPFVLNPGVIEKLRFVSEVIEKSALKPPRSQTAAMAS
jgi:hypothetical protein